SVTRHYSRSFPTRRSSDLLNTPSDGATYTAPVNVSLSATASDSDGIDRVEFYQGGTLVATSTNGLSDGTRAYTATWASVAAGTRSEEHTSELQSRVELVCR